MFVKGGEALGKACPELSTPRLTIHPKVTGRLPLKCSGRLNFRSCGALVLKIVFGCTVPASTSISTTLGYMAIAAFSTSIDDLQARTSIL